MPATRGSLSNRLTYHSAQNNLIGAALMRFLQIDTGVQIGGYLRAVSHPRRDRP